MEKIKKGDFLYIENSYFPEEFFIGKVLSNTQKGILVRNIGEPIQTNDSLLLDKGVMNYKKIDLLDLEKHLKEYFVQHITVLKKQKKKQKLSLEEREKVNKKLKFYKNCKKSVFLVQQLLG